MPNQARPQKAAAAVPRLAGPAYRSGLSHVEWLGIALAIGFAHLCAFRELVYSKPCCDAWVYQQLGERVALYGLFDARSFSSLRTYGYPLFLGALQMLRRMTSIPPALSVLETQLALYLFAAYLLRREIVRISRPLARVVFAGLCANFFVLIYTAESLTESLSLSVALLLGACWLWSVRVFRSRRYALAAAAGGALAGFAVMVRPANLYLAMAELAGLALLTFRRPAGRPEERMRRAAALALALVAMAAPSVPQLYNNIVFGHKPTPLIVDDLRTFQVRTGIAELKYATGVTPVPIRKVVYVNPFAKTGEVDPEHPLRWYLDHSGAAAATTLLHAFALLDQDPIFPYAMDLTPAYRLPVTLLNHILIGLAVCGLVAWGRAPGPLARISMLLMGVYILGVFGVYATTAAETRFGLPLLLPAPVLAALGWSYLRRMPLRRGAGWAGAIGLYVVLALAASQWMRAQSPAIWAWKTLGQNLALFGTTRQISTLGGHGPENGVDGVRTGIHAEPGVFNGFHTEMALNPWWEVDLGGVHRLTVARIYNAAPYHRAAGLRVLLSDDDQNWREVYDNRGRPFTTAPLVVPLSDARARFVRLQLPGTTWLHLEEVEIYGF